VQRAEVGWGLREAITGEFQPCCLASVLDGATGVFDENERHPHRLHIRQRICMCEHLIAVMRVKSKAHKVIGLLWLSANECNASMPTRWRCAIKSRSTLSHRLCDLNKLSNAGSSIDQHIYNVRSWWSDVVVWWAIHEERLIWSARCPTSHVQFEHSVSHMDRVSDKSTTKHQQVDSKLTLPLLTHDITPPLRSVHSD
jgi:hypothetical protein